MTAARHPRSAVTPEPVPSPTDVAALLRRVVAAVEDGTLDDHGVLASIGTVGDAYDNAMAESFVDSSKTELIRDRVWRSRSQLELAIVEYIASFNNERLHTSLEGVPPAESELEHATR